MPRESSFTTRARSVSREGEFVWGGTEHPWADEADTVNGVSFEDGVVRSTALPSNAIHHDFENGIPSEWVTQGSISLSLTETSHTGGQSLLIDNGTIEDYAYIELDEGNPVDEVYLEAWWRHTGEDRCDFFETVSHDPEGYNSDWFDDNGTYYFYDGHRRTVFDLKYDTWYLGQWYHDLVNDTVECRQYDVTGNEVANFQWDSNNDSTSAKGIGVRADGAGLLLDEVYCVPAQSDGFLQ